MFRVKLKKLPHHHSGCVWWKLMHPKSPRRTSTPTLFVTPIHIKHDRSLIYVIDHIIICDISFSSTGKGWRNYTFFFSFPMTRLFSGRVDDCISRFSHEMQSVQNNTNNNKHHHKLTHISVMYEYFSIIFLKIYLFFSANMLYLFIIIWNSIINVAKNAVMTSAFWDFNFT